MKVESFHMLCIHLPTLSAFIWCSQRVTNRDIMRKTRPPFPPRETTRGRAIAQFISISCCIRLAQQIERKSSCPNTRKPRSFRQWGDTKKPSAQGSVDSRRFCRNTTQTVIRSERQLSTSTACLGSARCTTLFRICLLSGDVPNEMDQSIRDLCFGQPLAAGKQRAYGDADELNHTKYT